MEDRAKVFKLMAELGGQIRTNFPVFLKSRMKRHQMKLMGDRFNSSKAATDFYPACWSSLEHLKLRCYRH